MRKIFSIFCLALLAISCHKESLDEPILPADRGALKMNVALAGTPAADQPLTVKVYRVTDTERQLIRRYTSLADIPGYLALLADNYCVTVEAGEKRPASKSSKSFRGEKEFAVTAGQVTAVTVNCPLLSTIVAVEYDATIAEKLESGYSATVAVGESCDKETIAAEGTPHLTFDASGEGYFVMPEGETSLAWRFEGTHPVEGAINKSGVIADVKPGARYTVKFKYSKDADGMLSITATVDESVEEFYDHISFSPDPTILGDGFDLSEEYRYAGGQRRYVISAQATISELKISVDGQTYDLLSGSHAGIAVTLTDDKNISVALSDEFFAALCGGSHTLTFGIKDTDGGKAEQEVVYVTQGINPLLPAGYDLWDCTATFSATVFDSATAAGTCTIAYREQGGEWKSVEAVRTAADTYTATGGDFFAGKQYEYRLLIDQTQTGAALQLTTPDGAQIPNGGMESWSKPGKAYFPYADGEAAFWKTGNEGSTTVGDNLTTPSTDIHAGSEGTTSAKLQSLFAGIGSLGKFAAGNLFIGEFSMSGMNGMVDFGRPFTYTAKPRALSFWLKNNPGQINYGSGKPASGTDINQAVIILANWTKPRRVDTSKIDETVLDVENLDKEPGVVAYGVFRTQEAATEWYERTIELTYISDERPNYIMISFAASAYGDYFCGSTDSYMYVDDIKLIY